jgi:hypothetical protein
MASLPKGIHMLPYDTKNNRTAPGHNQSGERERERERVEPLCSTRYGGVDRHHNAEESLPTSSCLCVPHLQDATDYLLHSAHKAPPKTTPWLPTCFQSTNQESQQITTTTPPPPRPQTINTYLLLQSLSTSCIFEQIQHYRGL